jgi:hypothetical protein
VGSVFGPIRFLLPVCRFCWFLYTFNIHLYMHIFRSNYWWQESDIWSQASYRYAILWEAFLDPSDSYFLFADLVGFYTHWTHMHIFRHIFLSNYWWLRTDIWSHASYMYPYRRKRFLTHQIPTSCLPTLLIFIHIEHTFCICPFLVTFFSATIDGRHLIFGHKLHIGTLYRGKRFLTRQIPTSCLPKSGDIISEH